MSRTIRNFLFVLVAMTILLTACSAQPASLSATATLAPATQTLTVAPSATATKTSTPEPTVTKTIRPTNTPKPTFTATPAPTYLVPNHFAMKYLVPFTTKSSNETRYAIFVVTKDGVPQSFTIVEDGIEVIARIDDEKDEKTYDVVWGFADEDEPFDMMASLFATYNKTYGIDDIPSYYIGNRQHVPAWSKGVLPDGWKLGNITISTSDLNGLENQWSNPEYVYLSANSTYTVTSQTNAIVSQIVFCGKDKDGDQVIEGSEKVRFDNLYMVGTVVTVEQEVCDTLGTGYAVTSSSNKLYELMTRRDIRYLLTDRVKYQTLEAADDSYELDNGTWIRGIYGYNHDRGYMNWPTSVNP